MRPDDATIVIVEDNFQNYVLMTRLLAHLGVKDCVWKESGWQVLEFAESLPQIDLILMDIFLPGSDGYALLERLRGHPRYEDTLIIAVTADVSVQNMRRAEASGFDGLIGKPLNPDLFPTQISSVLRGESIWDCG